MLLAGRVNVELNRETTAATLHIRVMNVEPSHTSASPSWFEATATSDSTMLLSLYVALLYRLLPD